MHLSFGGGRALRSQGSFPQDRLLVTAPCRGTCQVPWMQHCCKVISLVNKHFLHHFCVFYLNISWKSPGLACQLSQLPAGKSDERWKLPGHFDVCSTCVCCFCGAIEIWFENLCFHKQICLQCEFQISFFICSVLYINITDLKVPKTQDRSGLELFLTRTQSSKQNNFPVFPIYLTNLTHILLPKKKKKNKRQLHNNCL